MARLDQVYLGMYFLAGVIAVKTAQRARTGGTALRGNAHSVSIVKNAKRLRFFLASLF